MAGKIYVGDVGTEVILDTEEDLSTATTHNILWKSPGGSGTWVGEVVETTKVRYIIQAGDWNYPGLWKFQTSIIMPNWSGTGETAEEEIYEAFG